ncbi:UDP-glucose 6-dehydrogenase [Variovorax boronicumulans]
MKLAIFGAGYAGLSFAACMAEAGHEVLCADADAGRIEGLQQGRMPLHEPGLEALVSAGLSTGKLRFTADERAASLHGDMLFIVVNTPADGHCVSNADDRRESIARRLPRAELVARHGGSADPPCAERLCSSVCTGWRRNAEPDRQG